MPLTLTQTALALLLVGLASSVGGYVYGHHQGAAEQLAASNARAVQQLASVIDATDMLVANANDASRSLRNAQEALRAADNQSTEVMKRALAKTATTRDGCVFDADVMQQLAASRERAAQRAAAGVRHSVPAASAASQ